MNRNTTIESAYSADRRNRWERPAAFDLQAGDANFELSRRTSVIVLFLLSAGLWGAIYAAVASLTGIALW